MLPRISRAAHDGDASGGPRRPLARLRTSAVAIVPCAFAFLALGIPMATLMFSGGSGGGGATNIGYILMAFGIGLIPYSAQYVILRGFYAYEDTRTPFYNTVIVAAVNASCSALSYYVLPARWAVAGMAGVLRPGLRGRRRSRLAPTAEPARGRPGRHARGGGPTPAWQARASRPAVIGGAASYGIGQVLGSGVIGSLAALVSAVCCCSASSTPPQSACASRN
ncbi:hypothetical protein GCM10020221_23060 [Streptomyces thioluteus]|uniref:Uncharacterized protein n=1 Tax=Streptomyces thioluteus TaxID=66431 RepID=A0ABN3WV04_STRTU